MKKFLKSPWTISIAPALLSFLLTIIYDLIKGKRILSTVGSILAVIWNAVVTFLTFNLKVWWVIVGIVVILFVLYVIARVSEKNVIQKPDFTSYTEDRFRTWKWSWIWEQNYEHKWHAANLSAHCPKCDTPMLHDRDEDIFQCPRCKFQSHYDNHEKSYEVEAVIIDNLNRKQKKSGDPI